LKKVAQTKKPVIMSTGASTLAEIEEAVQTLKENGCTNLTLLKCTSTYPASPGNTNLLTIPHMRQLFDCNVGLSDHTLGIGVAVASIALGANVIEKHFCLSRAEGGVDSAFSLEPQEMKSLVEGARRAYQALGKVSYGISEAEKNSRIFKRSIYAAKDIKAGEMFTPDNIKIIRPGDGLHPRYFESILNKHATIDIKKGTPVTFTNFDMV
jgi:N-acetylneuraminate synthase